MLDEFLSIGWGKQIQPHEPLKNERQARCNGLRIEFARYLTALLGRAYQVLNTVDLARLRIAKKVGDMCVALTFAGDLGT